jgi:catechol 2,3-dioxygenase-like lactoylglutathione lyase family enzyme
MSVTDVLETSLYVDDLEAAERFYCEVLGLHFVARDKDRHVFLRGGRSMFLLFRSEATLSDESELPRHGATGPIHVAFSVAAAELESWKSHLLAAGVPIEQDQHWPNGARSLYFRDPSGNSLELASRRLWGLKER